MALQAQQPAAAVPQLRQPQCSSSTPPAGAPLPARPSTSSAAASPPGQLSRARAAPAPRLRWASRRPAPRPARGTHGTGSVACRGRRWWALAPWRALAGTSQLAANPIHPHSSQPAALLRTASAAAAAAVKTPCRQQQKSRQQQWQQCPPATVLILSRDHSHHGIWTALVDYGLHRQGA